MSRCHRIRTATCLMVITMPAAMLSGQERTPAPRPGADPPPRAEEVRIITDDNMIIAADYVPPARAGDQRAPFVILLHMYRSDRSAYAPLIPHLHRAGFAVMALDMRGHGASVGPAELELDRRVERRDPRLFADMHKDVEGAYLWLLERREVDPSRGAIVGASVGCSVALDYAARDPSVDAVVALTPGTNYLEIDSIAHLRKYGRRPLLLLASEKEREAADALGRIEPTATVEIIPGPETGPPHALHGTFMFGRVDRIEERITRFLREAVGPEAVEPVVASIRGTVYHPPDSSAARRLSHGNVRWFSSAEEAEKRGYRPAGRKGEADPDLPLPRAETREEADDGG